MTHWNGSRNIFIKKTTCYWLIFNNLYSFHDFSPTYSAYTGTPSEAITPQPRHDTEKHPYCIHNDSINLPKTMDSLWTHLQEGPDLAPSWCGYCLACGCRHCNQ